MIEVTITHRIVFVDPHTGPSALDTLKELIMTTHAQVLAAIADLKTDLTQKLTDLEGAVTAAIESGDETDVMAAISDLKSTVDAATIPGATPPAAPVPVDPAPVDPAPTATGTSTTE